MSKFVLDTSGLAYVNDSITSLENEMMEIASNVSGYDVGEASEFNFSGAISCIASNIEAASEKIKNTTTLIKNVIDTHTNLQSSLKFTVESVPAANPSNQGSGSSAKQTVTSTGKKSSASAATTAKTSGVSNGNTGSKGANSNNSVKSSEQKKDTNTNSNIELNSGKVINVPSGLGRVHTYMGWQLITSKSSPQYKLREAAGMNFDGEGFGKIDDRYVIACTTTFGEVGDYIDFVQEDGSVLKCIIGDIKNQNDRGCTKWGHDNGQTIVEFVVDKSSWYGNNHANPGTSSCHPEWKQNIVSATNYGNYFDKH